MTNTDVYNPPVPYGVAIPCGQKLEQQIFMEGTPTCDSTGFTVNLMSGPNFNCDNIILQIKVQFSPCDNTSTVVAQSRNCGQWQSAGPFFSDKSTYAKTCPVKMMLVPNCGEYVVSDGKNSIGAFKNINHCSITYLYIEGGLTLQRVYT